ncbi:C45 family autoproteolytic acyltransferase/hydolase [Natronobiforma cellulositropha]|uniref:C45 family autoproteolytic acyltransferase/hydolase n=1 Tax=Natronobiforma cellulositropha TaxID=1679076 RepID=UPI0021D5C189|nr:C45 family peptidase [Natronobiforma cellulositropha]
MTRTDDLEYELAADYRSYHVDGSHYDIGVRTAGHSTTAITPEAGIDLTPGARAVAEESREAVAGVFPELLEEFRGYAEALDLPEADLYWHFAPGVEGACSAVALETDDGLLVGRNYDFFYDVTRRHLVYTTPEVGYAHVGTHEGLVGGRFDGLNERGLFVAFTAAGEPDDSVAGMAFHLAVRYLLERCDSARDALETLRSLPLREPKGYLLVDGDDAFVVEAHPERTAVREPTAGVLALTNHFVDPAMTAYQPPWENSQRRYERLRALATLESPGRDALESALCDHDAPVCGHEDGLSTFWSCVAEPGAGTVTYALGAPCRNAYAWRVDLL